MQQVSLDQFTCWVHKFNEDCPLSLSLSFSPCFSSLQLSFKDLKDSECFRNWRLSALHVVSGRTRPLSVFFCLSPSPNCSPSHWRCLAAIKIPHHRLQVFCTTPNGGTAGSKWLGRGQTTILFSAEGLVTQQRSKENVDLKQLPIWTDREIFMLHDFW